MTTQDSQVDLEQIKQAFVEILLRKKAEADDPLESVAGLFAEPEPANGPADDDDPVESVAALFAEPEPADGPAGDAEDEDAGDDDDATDTGDAADDEDAGDTGEDEEPVDGLSEEPEEEVAEVAGSGYSDKWMQFLAMYGNQWDGKLPTWRVYREWIELFADDRGVMREALIFLDAAEAETTEADRIKFFARYGVTIGKQEDGIEVPDVDADGRSVDVVLSRAKFSDGGGDYLWVKVDDTIGKIYLKGHKFLAEDDAALIKSQLGMNPTEIPDTDQANRKIDEIRPHKDGTVVRIKDVWGRLDQENNFVALYPDDAAFADWSTRVISRDGYEQGGTAFSGEWFKPWQEQNLYVCRRAGGVREWARGSSLTANPGAEKLTVQAVLADIATEGYPDLL